MKLIDNALEHLVHRWHYARQQWKMLLPAALHIGKQRLRSKTRRLLEPFLLDATCVGGQRSAPLLPPLPTHRTWAPAPRWMASLSRRISSERRSPVWA